MSEDRMTIVAEPRSVTGKKVKQLRREGYVPGVLYGQSTPVNIQVGFKHLRRALRGAGSSQLATLELEGTSHAVLARGIQQHPTRRDVIHVDFFEVDLKTAVRAEVDLVAVGRSAPEEEGLGITTLALHAIEIECLPEDLVASIEVDMARIQSPDDTIHVRDLEVPKGVTFLTDPDAMVARFEFERAALEEEEEEGAVTAEEVEVIGRRKEDDFEEAGV
jgi:large subunit ribosomal protein L25